MLSRLSGLANTVLHELSGDGDDGDPEASAAGHDSGPGQGVMEDAPEDVLERLAQTEQLVVHLKTLIRDKDSQLQQKDVKLKEERDLADVKLAKLKLQAKAKVASLNKQIEDLKKSSPVPLAVESSKHTIPVSAAESQELSNGQNVGEVQGLDLDAMRLRLLEQDKTVQTLQETIHDLQEQLKSARDLENKQAEQLLSMQEVISLKDVRLQELVQHHGDELRELTTQSETRLQELLQQHEETLKQLAERSDAGADIQQTLRTLQRKHEEQEEALLGRTRVVEMLQQELQNADQQKQILSQQFRAMEAELTSLKSELDSEKQASKATAERMEVEEAAKETVISSLQGELQSLSLELQQMKGAQAEQDLLGSSKDEEHRKEVQNLTEALEQARQHCIKLELKSSSTDKKHEEEVHSLMEALEQSRRSHEELQLRGDPTEEAHTSEMLSIMNTLEKTKKDFEELELLGRSKDEMHRVELQRLMDDLEHARRSHTELEFDKNRWEETATQKMTELSEQSEIANFETSNGSSMKVEHQEGREEGDTMINHLLSRREELRAACDALEARKEELVQEVDRQTVQCDDLKQKINNMQETLSSSYSNIEVPSLPVMTTEHTIKNFRNKIVAECHDVQSEEVCDIVLTKTDELRSRELSILMMDMNDAQEEVSRLKTELPKIAENVSMADTPDIQVLEGESLAEKEIGQASYMQTEESITSVVHMEALGHVSHQEVQTSRSVQHLDSIMYTSCESGESLEIVPETIAMEQSFSKSLVQDLQKLQLEILHLQKAEDAYKRELEERDAKIYQLNQLVIENKEKTERKDIMVHVGMDLEEDASSKLVGLREQLQRLEWNLADAEKERLSDYESSTMQHSLLGEQINSLGNESKSKDMKIEALQKLLDQVQLQLCDQIALVKELTSQLQAKEEEVTICQEHLKERLNTLEELSLQLSLKDVKLAESEQLLLQNARDIDSLREALSEKEQQAVEISCSMSEKMVMLNEEKFSLMNDLKALKKQFESLDSREEATHELVKKEDESGGLSHKSSEYFELEKAVAILQKEKEERECQLACLNHENMQLQKQRDELQLQLQATHTNWLQEKGRLEMEALKGQVKSLEEKDPQQQTFRMQSLEKEVEELQVQLQTNKNELLPETEMKDRLLSEREGLQAQLATVQNDQFLQQSEIEKILQREREEFRFQMEDLTNKNLQQKEQLASLQVENRDLLTQLETLRNEQIVHQGEDFEKQPEQKLQHQFETFRDDHLQQSVNMDGMLEENQKLLNQLNTLQDKYIVEGDEMKEHLKKKNEEFSVQLQVLKNDSLQQNRILDSLRQENAELVCQLEKLSKENLQKDEVIVVGDMKDKALHHLETTENEHAKLLKVKDDLNVHLEEQKKDNERMKRKLQAALINRKELMRKIDSLENEIVLLGGQARKDNLINASTGEADDICKLNVEDQELSEGQSMGGVLKQQLSEKELELQNIKTDLADRVANEEKLQALIEKVTLDLQDKIRIIEILKVEMLENQSVNQKMIGVPAHPFTSDAAAVTDHTNISIASDSTQELPVLLLEGKISSLEQEKEQLQKKVQETLASRKDTIKKAQEKDRHHREQLKQQKEEYNVLQERFDEQNQQNVTIHEQLQELKKEVEEYRRKQSQENTVAVLPVSCEQSVPAQINLQDSLWGQEWVEFTSSEVEDTLKRTDVFQDEGLSVDQYKLQIEELKAQKAELETQMDCMENELSQNTKEIQLFQDQIVQLMSDLESSKLSYNEALNTVTCLKLELEKSQAEMIKFEELKNLQPQIEKIESLLRLRNEEKELLNQQLREKSDDHLSLQNTVQEKEDLIKALQAQMEKETKDHEEKSKRFQTEVLEVQQKQEEEAEENKSKQQIHRKLQAALISRKEALKESKSLKEKLASATNTISDLTNKLTVMGNDITNLISEKGNLLQESAKFQEERDKLITQVDQALRENQNLASSCESLKLALEGITQEKESLEKEMVVLRTSLIAENSSWQEKHRELQKEYETLLQSYENVSNETERIQRVLETVRQEKQELFSRMKSTEIQKKEVDKQLEEAEREMESMKEKMRKFAKSKQQKILELEEENEKLRTELLPSHSKKEFYDASVGENGDLKEELGRLQSEREVLASQLKAANAENVSLAKEINYLRVKLQSEETGIKEVPEAGDSVQDVSVQTDTAVPITLVSQEPIEERVNRESCSESSLTFLAQEQLKHEEGSSNDEINTYIQQVSQLQCQVSDLEKIKNTLEEELSLVKADFELLTRETNGLKSQVAAKSNEVNVLHETISELEVKNRETREELDKITKLKDTLEAEKDDLEERLMNQLAELNGSIGNYQQDATDFQSKSDSLELKLHGFQVRISELEEEKRQLEREKREVESQMQNEFVEKLKAVQTGERGRKTHAKELQELLREKQLEVKHLQKDCIRYQEKISSLERTVKAFEFVQSESLKEQAAAKERLAKVMEECKKAKTELTSFKILLDDTQSETARVLAESLKLKEDLQASKDTATLELKKKDEELEWRIEQERDKFTKETKNMQEKLDALQREKNHMEVTLLDLQKSLDKKTQDSKELQSCLNENLAKLAAFTRSMSSLQDDRDRVIDESKKWEKKITSAIQKKEEEIQVKDKACQVLKDQVKQMSILVEELQIKVSRSEHDLQSWESRLQIKEENHRSELESLQLEKKELVTQLEGSQKLHKDCQHELSKLDEEVKMVKGQLTTLDNSFRECDSIKEELEAVVKKLESEIQNYKFSCEQLQADLQASKELTNKLHAEIESKEQSIIGLLAAKEEAVLAATTELVEQHSTEVKGLKGKLIVAAEEKENLETEKIKLEKRLGALAEKMKTIKDQGREHKARLDSFTKSMSSLQDDRDRVLEEYKQLEGRHLAAIFDKDQLIQEAARENNELKEEIRGLYSGMDDLNSENAKIAAQLVRYREDLNQVITLKDSQQKQLVKAQLEQIHCLEEEKSILERQLRDSVIKTEQLNQVVNDVQEQKQKVASEAETLTLCVSQLNSELAALKGGGPLFELEVELQNKDRDLEGLSAKLLVLQDRIKELEDNILRSESGAEKNIAQMEDKHEKELKSLQHEAGIMRNETETAEVRVAELAKDLMEMEQRYLSVFEENEDLKAQAVAFGKSMSSLQDSRDEAEEQLEDMKKKYSSDLEIQEVLVQDLQKELTKLRGEQGLLLMERDSLSFELTSLKSNTIEHDLLSQVEQLKQQLISKDEEVARLSSELDSYSTQLKSFSKAMGSLQDERDRLLNELDRQRKVEEGNQQSAAGASPAQVQSMKNALSSLQNDRDRLLKELKNLQQQYLRIGEETGDIAQLRAQLQASQQQLDVHLSLQEQLKQESTVHQQELMQLREERMNYESQNERLKKHYLATLADKDQQLTDLQRLLQELKLQSSKSKVTEEQYQNQTLPEHGSEILKGDLKNIEEETAHLQSQLGDSLKQLHQKELRIQQLNSKLSQIFEEKKSLSSQLRGSSQNVRESQQRYNEVLKHCAVLEGQLRELQSQLKESVSENGYPMTDSAPGAPQEKNEPTAETYSMEIKELTLRLSEAQQHQISSEHELQRLEKLLSEERDQRLAAEEALFTSEEHVRRLETSHWAPTAQDHSFDVSSSHEHSLLIEPLDSTFSKTRGNSRLRRLLQYLFYSRTRTPLLVTLYLLTVHILLVLCFTRRL
ncbi:golgin subfamily B member 1-like isoform X1 [Pleurodeles waltl]|uniref:golgin subfamily B member 1-like isoform X1 n=2 Tax=Pleurodeles waltl TaxID=8319 RepID=UPI0037094DA5